MVAKIVKIIGISLLLVLNALMGGKKETREQLFSIYESLTQPEVKSYALAKAKSGALVSSH